ncbi:MAG: peptide deformylase [Burkholderiales bacterium]
MAILPILVYPDDRLHTVATPVSGVNDEIRRLIKDMAETMYAAPGIGLAATQVNVHKRIIIIDISDTHDQLQVLVNPEIVARSGDAECEEGCLSVPGVFEIVRRAAQVTVKGLDANGRRKTLDADGLLAVCLQHEIDHLDGKVFVEHLSRLKRSRIVNKLEKQRARAM